MIKSVAALACLVLLGACGSNDSTAPAEPTPTSAPAPTPTTAPAEPATTTTTTTTTAAPATTEPAGEEPAATINISGLSFGAPVTVSAGDTVEVVNRDSVPHTWTSDDDLFDVSLSEGGRTTFTFEEPGEYTFFCAIHPGMAGSVTVEG